MQENMVCKWNTGATRVAFKSVSFYFLRGFTPDAYGYDSPAPTERPALKAPRQVAVGFLDVLTFAAGVKETFVTNANVSLWIVDYALNFLQGVYGCLVMPTL